MKKLTKIVFTLFALLCAWGAEAQGNTNLCFRYPVRVVGNTKVDLSYLFSHWQTATNAVTNSAWVRLTGTVVGNSGGWIVEGETDSAGKIKRHQRVLVLNPPMAEKVIFDNASAELDAVNGQRSKIREAAVSYEGQAGGMHISVRGGETTFSGTNGVPILVIGKKSDDLQQQIDSTSTRVAELNKVIQGIPHTDTRIGKIYQVDFFVLSTGKIMNGLPVLDFGVLSR